MRIKLAKIGLLAVALMLLTWVSGALADTEKELEKLELPPLGEIKVPDPERWELDNGIVVYFLEDHEFPIVDVQARVRAGEIYEPKDKIGLATLTGEVMRSGGSERHPGDDLDLSLENMGARIEINFGGSSGTAFLSTLSDDVDTGVEIMADVIQNPTFPEDKIELGKVELRTEIASRNDEPVSILNREFSKTIFGADSPYGWHTEYATVEAVTREDMMDFHKKYVRPDQMIMTVYGDFDTDAVKAKLQETFGGWTAAAEPLPPDPALPSPKSPTVYYAEKEGVTNSSIAMGHLGMLASDPDYPTMRILGRILGGGFASRLFSEIRSRRGLAYAVFSTSGTGFHHPGTFYARVETRIDSTVTTIRAIQEEFRKIREEGVTEDELNIAKEAILNGLVFDFSSKGAVLNRMAFYEFYGYPPDFLQTYQEAVRNVTAADVQEVAQRRIRPEEMQILVVGVEEEFDEPLSALGLTVNEIDITIPEPESKLDIPEATAENLEEGSRVLKASMTIKLPFGTMAQVFDGEAAWMDTPMGTQQLPPPMVEEMRAGLMRNPVSLLSKVDEHKAQMLEQVEMEDVLCNAVHIHHDSVKEWVIYFDAKSNMPVRMDYRSIGQSGPVAEATVYGGWLTVDGVKLPASFEVRQDGEKVFEVNVTGAAINEEPDPSLFQPPSDVGDSNP
jgi:zinc protease